MPSRPSEVDSGCHIFEDRDGNIIKVIAVTCKLRYEEGFAIASPNAPLLAPNRSCVVTMASELALAGYTKKSMGKFLGASLRW